jgi:pimeloyl-ACP methyl ester carboxylesterase
LKKPFIQGVSMGGWATQQFAMQYSDYVSGIILLETEAYVDANHISAAFAKRAGKEAGEIARKFFQPGQSSNEIVTQYVEKCLPLCASSKNPIPPVYFKRIISHPEVSKKVQKTFDCRTDLSKITCPVLYLTNTNNPVHLFEAAKETAEAMVNADVTFVPFADCDLVQFDAREQGVKEIERFLSKYHHGNR